MVNEQIRANHSIDTNIMDIDAAKANGAMALFGEKYDDQVRVLSMGDFSTELCGGVHANRTGDIGLFKILSESGIAAGIRRIEAVTGAGAIAAMHTEDMMLANTARLVKSDVASVVSKVDALVSHSKQLEKEIQQLKDKLAAQEGAGLINQVQEINGVKVLIAQLDGADNKALRGMVDELKNQLGSAVVILGNVSDDKVGLIAGVTKDLIGKVKAGELVNLVALQVGGKGGGRPDMAQAGGTDAAALPAALATVAPWLADKL